MTYTLHASCCFSLGGTTHTSSSQFTKTQLSPSVPVLLAATIPPMFVSVGRKAAIGSGVFEVLLLYLVTLLRDPRT